MPKTVAVIDGPIYNRFIDRKTGDIELISCF